MTIEIAGLESFPDPYERYAQQRVKLLAKHDVDKLATALYFQRKLVRDNDGRWVVRVLDVLSRWDERRREEAEDQMCLLFEELFSRHRALLHSR